MNTAQKHIGKILSIIGQGLNTDKQLKSKNLGEFLMINYFLETPNLHDPFICDWIYGNVTGFMETDPNHTLEVTK